MKLISKFGTYVRAAAAQKSLNWRGLPFPKSLWPNLPANREAFNQFLIWIRALQLSRVSRVLDVGANHGDFALAASTIYPGAEVLLVEPLPTLQGELERRCAGQDGRWRLEPCALGGEAGTAMLHVDPNADEIGSLVGASEMYLKANPKAKADQSFPCRVRTLDELCLEKGIAEIDLMKMDVEGFEFEAVRGGARMLGVTRALIIEVSLVRREDGAKALTEMLEVLREAGLRLVHCSPSLYSIESPWLPVEFNLLARRP